MVPALATLTLVWLGAQKPEGRAQTALETWAESKGVKLEAPRPTPPEDFDKSIALATQCDQALDQARDQMNSADTDAARQTLRQLEQTLRDHPELLQAAWLMAERYRLEALIAARDPSKPGGASEEAAAWDRRADILEGARAAAFGSIASKPNASSDNLTVTLVVRGPRRYEAFWDGVSMSDNIATPAGEHHVLIRRDGRTAWSGWISVLSSGPVDVWVPGAPPCSMEDLSEVALGATNDPVVPNGIRCEAWAWAAPGTSPGTLRMAICRGERCEPTTTSAYETFASSIPGTESGKKAGLPGWATWTIAGAGVAAVTTMVLWGTGAFDHADPGKKVVWVPP
jgi:hypothetical protein